MIDQAIHNPMDIFHSETILLFTCIISSFVLFRNFHFCNFCTFILIISALLFLFFRFNAFVCLLFGQGP